MSPIGERIKSARLMANLSQRDLAEAASISAMAISKYERNLDIPGSAVLLRLSKALGVKIEYFFRPTSVTLSIPVHRKHTSFSILQDASILEHIQDWLERYLDIEILLERDTKFTLPISESIEMDEDIETAALALRERWQLGLGPIEGLIEVCEEHGIKVGLVGGHADFDAITLYTDNNVPVIVLRNDISGDHQRFCLAQELSYLFLKPAKHHTDAENVAPRFARAFLVPRPTIEQELGSKRQAIGIFELYLLKRKYGLSMWEWIQRAKDLSILSDATVAQMLKHFRSQGWNREEPGNSLPSETPQRFERLVLHALCEGIISQARAAELLAAPLDQFIGGEVERDGGFLFEMCG